MAGDAAVSRPADQVLASRSQARSIAVAALRQELLATGTDPGHVSIAIGLANYAGTDRLDHALLVWLAPVGVLPLAVLILTDQGDLSWSRMLARKIGASRIENLNQALGRCGASGRALEDAA